MANLPSNLIGATVNGYPVLDELRNPKASLTAGATGLNAVTRRGIIGYYKQVGTLVTGYVSETAGLKVGEPHYFIFPPGGPDDGLYTPSAVVPDGANPLFQIKVPNSTVPTTYGTVYITPNNDLPYGENVWFTKGDYLLDGEVRGYDNSGFKGDAGAWLFQTAVSLAGSFLTNAAARKVGFTLNNSSSLSSFVDNFRMENLNLSGDQYPDAVSFTLVNPTIGTRVIGTTTYLTCTLPSSASGVTNAYAGLTVAFPGVDAGFYICVSYDAALKELRIVNGAGGTASAVWAGGATVPANGDVAIIGWNDNSYGGVFGLTAFKDWGGISEHWETLKFIPWITGAKGINHEQGNDDCSSFGRTHRYCGQAVFLQGIAGRFYNGSWKGVTNIRYGCYMAEECGSALTVSSAAPTVQYVTGVVISGGGTTLTCSYSSTATDVLEDGMTVLFDNFTLAQSGLDTSAAYDLDGTEAVVESLDRSANTFVLQVSDVVTGTFSVVDSTNPPNVAAAVDGSCKAAKAQVFNVTYHNCGHNPYRVIRSGYSKSGIVNLPHAQNLIIKNFQGYNDTTYPGPYPSESQYFYCSAGGDSGLSGNIGALIWGTGWNVTVDGFRHTGDVDAVVHIGRARPLGQDGRGRAEFFKAKNFDFKDIEVFGTVDKVLDTNTSANNRPSNANTTGTIQCVVDTITASTGVICSTSLDGYTNLILDVTERDTGKRIIGTPDQIIARGNTFAAFEGLYHDLRNKFRLTIADDSCATIEPPISYGIACFACNASTQIFDVRYKTTAPVEVAFTSVAGSSTAVATTSLDGTTGADNKITIGAEAPSGTNTQGLLYIENRLGASIIIDVFFPIHT